MRYYGIGAQIIKDLNIKNMILISRVKNDWTWRFSFKIKQIIIKWKILIVNANYYKDISKKLLSSKKLINNRVTINIMPGIYEIPIAIRKNIKNMMVCCFGLCY